ncbi:MAG: pyruvate formate lyase-activating protein [Chloroflexota bacterium]|nr:MAG: pyruvate formate lyase-activating protein [Chloroflexota bacterium]
MPTRMGQECTTRTAAYHSRVRIICVDVGTGTQDILLFDSAKEIENCVQMVMPSPTVTVAARVRRATERGEPIVLTGVTAGGGPSMWAVEDHLRAGYPVYAVPAAAQSFDDDLKKLARLGIRLIDANDVERHDSRFRVEMADLNLFAIAKALEAFGVEPEWDALAVAVFDHGAAPPDVSDRRFRFNYLARALSAERDLVALAHRGDAIPPFLTRMRAVAATAPADIPLVVMDTGPAAALGAQCDSRVRDCDPALLINIGNLHTLAFHVEGGAVVGLFEHHTGELTGSRLGLYLDELVEGTISNDAVFADKGHGALTWTRRGTTDHFRAVTGPRRALLAGTTPTPYAAAPCGDMMLTGCFGLLRACARYLPEATGAIHAALGVA